MATRVAGRKPSRILETRVFKWMGEAGQMFAIGLESLHVLFRRPWPRAEFIDQVWFLVKVTTVPTILVSIPFGMIISHPPITRRERVVARRLLWFRWGDVEEDVTRTQTIFRFSRPETKAAKAIRASLEERSLPHEPLRFKQRSREKRTRGSRVLATRR